MLRQKLYSMFANKCPKCHQGSFFIYNNPYKLKYFDKMNTKCSVCGESFERETGFYSGSMYINYGLTVILGLSWFVVLYLLFGFNALGFLISYSILLIVLMPVVYRTGRLLWINIFVNYDKSKAKEVTGSK